MLKWDDQPQHRSRSWQNSIREHRRRVLRQLARNPGLKARLDEALSEAYQNGPDRASAESDLDLDVFPSVLPYSWDAIMNRAFDLAPPDAENKDVG